MNERLLAVPVLFPILCGLIILAQNFRPNRKEDDRRLGILAEGVVLVNSAVLAWLLFTGTGKSVLLFRLFGNLTVRFRLDRMGGVFAGMIAFMWPLATLYALEYMRGEPRRRMFFGFYVMTYGVTAGIALAGNLVTMYLCYEMLTLVTFPLVLYPMTREAKRASRRYLYYSIGGAAFAFIGLVFVLTFSATGNTEFVPGGVLDPVRAGERRNLLLFIYVLAFCGFGVKAALFPFHVWLPRATVAPTPVTALLHAVAVVKSGAFAILRLTYFSFGTAFLRGSWAQRTVMALALITILFGSTTAVRETHWKRRLAYSTVANLSYILFGASLMTPAGLAAALCHLAVHGFTKICAFFCAGAVQNRTGKTDVRQLDGEAARMPATFACFTVSALSLMGAPLFGGFISKWNLARAALSLAADRTAAPWGWLPAAGTAVILYSALMTSVYMLTASVRAYFPRRGADMPERAGGARLDPGWRMMIPVIVFAAVTVLLGVCPAPFLRVLALIGGEAG